MIWLRLFWVKLLSPRPRTPPHKSWPGYPLETAVYLAVHLVPKMAPRSAMSRDEETLGGNRASPTPRPDDLFYEALHNGLCFHGLIHAYRWEELCTGCVSGLASDVQPLYIPHSVHYLLLDTALVFNLGRCTTCAPSVLLEHAPGACRGCVLFYEAHRDTLVRVGYGEVTLIS
ncbi:uncharacterized protein LOC112494253 [Cephus cinctus]|uniref:Uncharacterized protein LOC112494253 n=1 Tax=Cephus cinctus TaxID=211228 RepID=A0AAJ7W0K0_CEPCN|nr:uncharacterized protein LOC112494253 [Cephus cinctus]